MPLEYQSDRSLEEIYQPHLENPGNPDDRATPLQTYTLFLVFALGFVWLARKINGEKIDTSLLCNRALSCLNTVLRTEPAVVSYPRVISAHSSPASLPFSCCHFGHVLIMAGRISFLWCPLSLSLSSSWVCITNHRTTLQRTKRTAGGFCSGPSSVRNAPVSTSSALFFNPSVGRSSHTCLPPRRGHYYCDADPPRPDWHSG